MKVAFYAVSPFNGPAVRGLAVARAVQADSGAQCLLLGPQRFREWARRARVPLVSPPEHAYGNVGQIDSWAREGLRQFAPDVLVVDTWPHGASGELNERTLACVPDLVLLTRSLPPSAYLRPDLSDTLQRLYHAQLWTEPPPPALRHFLDQCTGVRQVAPALFVRPQDVQSATAGRGMLGIHERERTILGIGGSDAAGERARFDALTRAARRLRAYVVFAACHLAPTATRESAIVNIFPIGAWLRAFSVVVTPPTCQKSHEVVQAGVPAVFVPQSCPFDEQEARAARLADPVRRVARNEQELVDRLDSLLVAGRGGRYGPLAKIPSKTETRMAPGGGAFEIAQFIAGICGPASGASGPR